VTRSEFIRRLNEVAVKPSITPAESMLIDAVCALTEQVELQSAATDMRRWCWVAAYVAKLATSSVRGEYPAECRKYAMRAAQDAVTDYDAAVAVWLEETGADAPGGEADDA
jgi:hypothetical protein